MVFSYIWLDHTVIILVTESQVNMESYIKVTKVLHALLYVPNYLARPYKSSLSCTTNTQQRRSPFKQKFSTLQT